jgi:hypothetical protein
LLTGHKRVLFPPPPFRQKPPLWQVVITLAKENILLFPTRKAELTGRGDIPLLLEEKSSFKLVSMESASPCYSLTDYSFEVALLLNSLTYKYFDKSQF